MVPTNKVIKRVVVKKEGPDRKLLKFIHSSLRFICFYRK